MRRKYTSSQGDINRRCNKVDFAMYSVYFVSKLLIENKQRNLSLMVYYTSSFLFLSFCLGLQVVRNFISLVSERDFLLHSFEVQILQSRRNEVRDPLIRLCKLLPMENFNQSEILILLSSRILSECPCMFLIEKRDEDRKRRYQSKSCLLGSISK